MGYVYIFSTVAFTVYGQLVIKWQVSLAGQLPDGGLDKLGFLLRLLMTPWVMSGFVAGLLASLTWMAAMTRFDLSHAYPFTSAAFVLVLIFSALLFGEPLTMLKLVGTGIIVVGIIVASQG